MQLSARWQVLPGLKATSGFLITSQSCLRVETIRHLLPLITDYKCLFCSRFYQYFPKYKRKYNAKVIAISRSEADGKWQKPTLITGLTVTG